MFKAIEDGHAGSGCYARLDANLLTPPGMGRGTVVQTSDTNGTIAALLRDLASVQTSQHSRWGYKRAAAAIRNLEAPIESFLQADGTLRKIPHWPLDRLFDLGPWRVEKVRLKADTTYDFNDVRSVRL